MLNFATLFSVFVLWIPYSRKIWQGIKFGSLAVHVCVKTAKLKSANFFLRVHVRMVIPYHTAKFKSTNDVKNVVLGQTAKFNDRQYFRLYGIYAKNSRSSCYKFNFKPAQRAQNILQTAKQV